MSDKLLNASEGDTLQLLQPANQQPSLFQPFPPSYYSFIIRHTFVQSSLNRSLHFPHNYQPSFTDIRHTTDHLSNALPGSQIHLIILGQSLIHPFIPPPSYSPPPTPPQSVSDAKKSEIRFVNSVVYYDIGNFN